MFRSSLSHALLFVVSILFSQAVTAVHECGTPHSGYSGPVDATHGCSTLKETDFFNGDPRADAPELSPRGPYTVGVRTLRVINHDQLDILNYSPESPDPRYDRELVLEVWYPAELQPGEEQITTYNDVLGSGPGNPERPLRPFEFGGRAARDSLPLSAGSAFPLVIVSHGYPGSRVLLTWLTENLASKGYVVVAIDHMESTHADARAVSSTLIHRPRDISFVLADIAARSSEQGSFLNGIVDAEQTAVVGYSMGSYGALSATGLGASDGAVNFAGSVPGGHLASLQAGNPDFEAMLDPRIKAIVTMAPYAPPGYWDPQTLGNLVVPSFIIVGSQDRTTGFAAAQWLFDNAVNSDRHLLVYQGAIHEIAPNPAPPLAEAHIREYIHYQEPAWDNRRLNNINQHFITAFLGKHLKKDSEKFSPFLKLSPIANDSPRTDKTDPDYWKGFANWTAIGMEIHHRAAGQEK